MQLSQETPLKTSGCSSPTPFLLHRWSLLTETLRLTSIVEYYYSGLSGSLCLHLQASSSEFASQSIFSWLQDDISSCWWQSLTRDSMVVQGCYFFLQGEMLCLSQLDVLIVVTNNPFIIVNYNNKSPLHAQMPSHMSTSQIRLIEAFIFFFF